MAARLTDRQKQKIMADYVQLGNCRAVARLNGCSDGTVRKIMLENPEVVQKYEQKRMENTESVLAYMDQQKDLVCEIIGKGLMALNMDGKLEDASPSQITTAIGTLIDKWTAAGRASDAHAESGVVILPGRTDGNE